MTKCWDPIIFDALALGPNEQSRMQFKIWKEEEERGGEMGKRGGSGSTAKGSDMKGYYRQRKSKPSRKSPFITTPSLNKPSPSAGVTLGSDPAQPPAVLSYSSPDLSEDWDEAEEMLRQFDMNMSYGPCLGLTRLERWERANALGLDPPKDIEGFLRGGKVELECLWDGRV